MYADNLTDVGHILHGYILSSIHLFDVERIIGRLINNMSSNISNMLLILSKCYVNMDIFYYYHYNIYVFSESRRKDSKRNV